MVPREVEDMLRSTPGGRDAAVIGTPDRLLRQGVRLRVAGTRGDARQDGALHLLRREPLRSLAGQFAHAFLTEELSRRFKRRNAAIGGAATGSVFNSSLKP